MTNLSLIKPPPTIPAPSISIVMPIQEEFHNTFEVKTSEANQQLYLTLIEEEHEEWVEDFYNELAHDYDELKELADLLYVTAGAAYQYGFKDIKAIACPADESWDWTITQFVGDIASGKVTKDIFGKLIYCLYAYAKHMNWDLNEAYKRVHKSNMSKLTADGKVLRREDGKVLKSDLYTPPDLKDLTEGN